MKEFLASNRGIAFLLFILALLVLTAAPIISCVKAPSVGLTVFAAAGAKPALDEISRKFEAQYHAAVEVTYGGGGEVLSQMELSRSGDVYVAPEQRFMEMAVEKKVVIPETITIIAHMIPVIALPKDNPRNIKTLEDLANPGVKVAVTRKETTLLGEYAPEIFAKAGLAEEIGNNIVTEAARPDNLLTMLIMKQVDAGIIWNFYEVQASDEIQVIYLAPEQLTGVGEMRAAVSSYTTNTNMSQQFVNFLTSPESKEIFGRLGYIVDDEELKRYWQ
jgi:molybdate transport system substrate-binding protein